MTYIILEAHCMNISLPVAARLFVWDLMTFSFIIADVRYFSCKQRLRWRRPRFHIGARGRSGGSIRDRRNIRWWAECKVSQLSLSWRLFLHIFIAPLCCTWLIDVDMFSFKIYAIKKHGDQNNYSASLETFSEKNLITFTFHQFILGKAQDNLVTLAKPLY